MSRFKHAPWLLALAVFIAYPLIVTNPAWTTIGIFTLIFMACATSWNMFSGYSGYVNLGSAVFYGSGAYTMALLASHLHMAGNGDLFWLVPLGGVVASIIAIPVGLVALPLAMAFGIASGVTPQAGLCSTPRSWPDS